MTKKAQMIPIIDGINIFPITKGIITTARTNSINFSKKPNQSL